MTEDSHLWQAWRPTLEGAESGKGVPGVMERVGHCNKIMVKHIGGFQHQHQRYELRVAQLHFSGLPTCIHGLPNNLVAFGGVGGGKRKCTNYFICN
jgi:hypothetical protein